MTMAVAALAMPGMLWCSASQNPPVAQAVGGLGEGQGLVEGAAGVAAFDDGRQVED